jgi:NADPH-dependent 2,4-dienoyl-CoA reductase/sulfur reductase-like enzyme
MKRWTRRAFGGLVGASLLTTLRPGHSVAKGRVVVVGGGAGGATAAKYLAMSGTHLDVTLIEPSPRYVTCFFSNHYLAGLRPFDTLTHGYETLAQKYGIGVIHDSAAAIDPVAKAVRLTRGASLPYDRLVLAPGIAFREGGLAGYDAAAMQTMPHAWMAGPQTLLLRQQLESMEDGGVFVIVVPQDPMRCPPAPYERACLVASYFQRTKPRAKILILDAKDSFFEQDLFQDAWNRHYPGMIEWLPAQFTGGVTAVDATTRSIVTSGETFKAAVANVIPPQMAGHLAQLAGLADRSGWCPVDPLTFESTRQPGIHLVGDAIIAGQMPKSAFSANSQAKACAFAITAALTGAALPAPHLFNTCYAFLGPDDAVSNVSSFIASDGTIKTTDIFISKVEENAATRRRTARQGEDWYDAFTHDMLG